VFFCSCRHLRSKTFFVNTVDKHSFFNVISLLLSAMLLKGDSMHLELFRKKMNQTQSAFGATLVPAASQALVSQWERGETRVTLSYALQINKQTAGEVTAQDCADMFKESGAGQVAALSPQPA
jgi:DNA-binding transcriptional regulator YdaS (Cro superfamily)